jgi:hypothetical protein
VIAREAASSGISSVQLSCWLAQHSGVLCARSHLRPSTLIAALQDWITSLSRHGLKRIYFLNGHEAGNVASIELPLQKWYAAYSLQALRVRSACVNATGGKLAGGVAGVPITVPNRLMAVMPQPQKNGRDLLCLSRHVKTRPARCTHWCN